MKLLVKDIGTLVTVCQGRTFLAGPDMANISVRTGCLALAVDDQGHIAMLGSQEEVDLKQYLPLVLSSVAGGRKVCRVFSSPFHFLSSSHPFFAFSIRVVAVLSDFPVASSKTMSL